MELNKKSLAMTSGLLWGLCVFLTTIWVMVLGNAEGLDCLVAIYPGYCVSIGGAFLGLVYGVVDGLIAGYVFAWLYNKMLPKPV